MVEITTYRVMPIVGSAIGIYETVTHGGKFIKALSKGVFLGIQESYNKNLKLKVEQIQIEKAEVRKQLVERIYSIFLAIITIIPVLGGIIRNLLEMKDTEALKLYQEGMKLKNDKDAYDKIYQAASLHCSDAQCETGLRLIEGRGCNQDLEFGKLFLRLSSHNFNTRAKFLLSRLHEIGGNGFDKDPKVALKYCREAALSGYAEAQDHLGNIYYNGINGENKDEERAFFWYEKAALQGYADSQSTLGYIYYEGLMGQQQDYNKAVSWFEKAALQNHVDGRMGLASCLIHGNGIAVDGLRAWRIIADFTIEFDSYDDDKRGQHRTAMGMAHYLTGEMLRDGIHFEKDEDYDAWDQFVMAKRYGYEPVPLNTHSILNR